MIEVDLDKGVLVALIVAPSEKIESAIDLVVRY